MIGYRISYQDLAALVEGHCPGWVEKASTRTAGFIAAGKYKEASSIWSDVKVVYMRLQGEGKCIFCERKLESERYGKGEQDVEHFRPKGSVRAWKASSKSAAKGVAITNPGTSAPGYHRLPYHLFNYGAACKPCNSALKKDCFPIAGNYDFDGDDPSSLKAERPLLIYPFGDFDDDPEDLIAFEGASPLPVQTSGHGRDRALTTIEFFALADPSRKNLFRERAVIMAALWPQLEAASADPSDEQASGLVSAFQSNKAPHANCARSFARLYRTNRAAAKGLYKAAVDLIMRSS